MNWIETAASPGFDKIVRMIVLCICLLMLGAIGIYCMVSGKNPDGISMILTGIISVMLHIVGYDWGSSAGSKSKDEVIGRMLSGKS